MLQARAYFEQAMELDPANIEAMVGLAMADAATGAAIMADDWSARFSAAETILTRVLSLAPNHAQAYLFLGLVQMLTRRIVQGIAECERASVLDRNLATAHGVIGTPSIFLVEARK
jgi:tetratricopeptide (TPR) repeat protein